MWTTNFLNKDTENIQIIRSTSPEKMQSFCMQILARNLIMKKKNKKQKNKTDCNLY